MSEFQQIIDEVMAEHVIPQGAEPQQPILVPVPLPVQLGQLPKGYQITPVQSLLVIRIYISTKIHVLVAKKRYQLFEELLCYHHAELSRILWGVNRGHLDRA
jgi:hypothetical protein